MRKEKRFFTTRELAEMFEVTAVTVWRWIQEGRIRAIRVGRKYLIPADVVERIMSDGLILSQTR